MYFSGTQNEYLQKDSETVYHAWTSRPLSWIYVLLTVTLYCIHGIRGRFFLPLKLVFVLNSGVVFSNFDSIMQTAHRFLVTLLSEKVWECLERALKASCSLSPSSFPHFSCSLSLLSASLSLLFPPTSYSPILPPTPPTLSLLRLAVSSRDTGKFNPCPPELSSDGWKKIPKWE